MKITRKIVSNLVAWKNQAGRRPLVVRGARQIGKSRTIREFGQSHFENLVEVNLEQSKRLRDIFQNEDPLTICAELSLETNQPIIPGKTLLFIDEIQESSQAFLSLRYFFEKMPDLHVVCAGSLLDLVMDKDQELRVPVGRVEYCYMFPLSFMEFLEAIEASIAQKIILELTVDKQISESMHQKLHLHFNEYIVCGGMPAVVDAYRNSKTDLRYRKLQADLTQTFKEDFKKYRTRIEIDKLEGAFDALPRYLCKDLKYSEICPDYAQATTKNILNLFKSARIINFVQAVRANGLPLAAETVDRAFKYVFLDVGLYGGALGLNSQDMQRWNYDFVNCGAIAEQVVGQELLANSNSSFDPKLYFWKRDKKGSSAEVDFLYVHNQNILPLEVKAGTTGRLKSLRIFLEEKKSKIGIRVSQKPLSFEDQVLSVPFYALSQLDNLISQVI